jgi:hypothetical protein
MAGHVHAALMAEYAKDAADNERPWELWEYNDGKSWRSVVDGHPFWSVHNSYRRKPRLVLIGDFSFPEPVREALTYGDRYYFAAIRYGSMFDKRTWVGDGTDSHLLRSGFVHLSEENAVLHAKALILASGGMV